MSFILCPPSCPQNTTLLQDHLTLAWIVGIMVYCLPPILPRYLDSPSTVTPHLELHSHSWPYMCIPPQYGLQSIHVASSSALRQHHPTWALLHPALRLCCSLFWNYLFHHLFPWQPHLSFKTILKPPPKHPVICLCALGCGSTSL